ncbi:hypothetical protein [Pseudonocardia sp.]|uniref:hypothetical protein n=1 Tax=Pseudonocardia sp. TaxID=60912 RepID=UPI00263907BD|nr:hypothetical protein [Pseudonocardia sp.]
MYDDGVYIGWGLALLAAGLLLCFTGARSLRLAAACAGFGMGSVLADALGAGWLGVLLVGAAGAVGALVLAGLVVQTGFFVVGALAGGAIAAAAFRTFSLVEWSPTLVVIVVLSAALLGGVGATQVRSPVLAVVTALAGAGLALRGAVTIAPFLGFLREPDTLFGSLVATAVWLVLAVAGWTAQRRSGRAPVP